MNAPLKPAPLEAPQATPTEAPPRRASWLGRIIAWLLVLALLGGAGAWLWYRPQPAQQGPARMGPRGAGGPPVSVAIAPAERRDVPISLEALGTVQATNTITVRAQVDGQLVEIAFREGQEVKRGDVLARIDPRAYQAALDQALAKKAQNEALLANARLDLQRYAQLARSQGVSQQQQDTQRAQVAQYEALVAADQAQIDAARTQLDFTTIRAPIDGRVGLRGVDQGNLVRAGDATAIATVAQIKPITVIFTLPQQNLPQIRRAMQRGPVAVTASVPGAGEEPVRGELLTIDNAVDQTTGTIRLKASFPNDDYRLWPGAFATVRIQVDTLANATTVPLVAVQRGPDGAYAFVLRPPAEEGTPPTVQQRPLTLGPVTQTLAVVQEGLRPGERVVTSGALRLSDGARVAVTEGAGGGQGPRRRQPAAEGSGATPAPAPRP